jgi:pyruvate dehydrogenase E2 component (dihydrolipoamide acetyltransferase)
MPKLGLTMTEGLLAEWRVKPGDRIRAGEVVFVVETDKIANEIEAPSDGEILELMIGSGETVPVGTALARWTGVGIAGGVTGRTVDGEQAQPHASQAQRNPPQPGSRIKATPLARRIARDSGINLSAVNGSGPGGRIKAADVETAPREPRESPVGGGADVAAGADRVPLAPRHLAMVRRVVASAREVPHFYVTRPAEVSALMSLRPDVNAAGPKLTLNHFILKAVGRALLAVPEANRIWSDDALIALPSSDVGVVVHTPDGLLIPVLRNVGHKTLDQVSGEAGELAERARMGRLERKDMEGGAISVSNLGMAGVATVTPIISPPQSAILGVGAISELFRPDRDGAPVLRRELVLTLACDHRVFDGMTAARFLDAIVGGLEAPHSLFLTTEPRS